MKHEYVLVLYIQVGTKFMVTFVGNINYEELVLIRHTAFKSRKMSCAHTIRITHHH